MRVKIIELKWGGTRIALLFGSKAYKLPRFRLIRPFLQLFRHLKNGEVAQRLERFDIRPQHAIIKYILAGLIANREEWYISRTYPSEDKARVFGLYFRGFLLVQERGEHISDTTTVTNHSLWDVMLRHKCGDSVAACAQFANFNGVVKVIDLGRSDFDPHMFL